MEIPTNFDQLRGSSARFACTSTTNSNLFSKERWNFHFKFKERRCSRRGACSLQKMKIQCSLIEHSLKPRPQRSITEPNRPLNGGNRIEEKKIMEDEGFGSGICTQIEKLVLHGKYSEALELFEFLECKGQVEHGMGDSTYDALISACIGMKSIRGVKRLFNYMVSNGFEADQYLSNRVLTMHVRCGMMIDALKVFDEMPERNMVSWNTIIGGLVDSGDFFEAFRRFFMMQEEISGAGSRTIATMIQASAGLDLIYSGRQFHSWAFKMGVADDMYVSCVLINMYSKCGSIKDARFVFDVMPEKTTVGWNTIIAGYALHGCSEEALSLYYEMRDSGIKVDHFTFSMIISVCTRLASLENVKQAHAGLVRHGFGSDIVANTALVDFYSKWGRIEDARNVFERMPQKNLISWNALIAGYGHHGLGAEAVELFDRMINDGMVPNHVTFLAVLSACKYSGLFDHGCRIFYSMTRDFKVKPRAMHYACMIELLGREGHLDEALALLRDAPFKPSLNMWAALLTACRVHENFELGKFAAEKLHGMGPVKLINYVVLLNIYNSSGRSDEAATVVRALKRKGLRMLHVCTWIEIKKQSYAFISADKRHKQTKEMYEQLDKLMQEISKHGYQPEGKSLLPDVDEREAELVHYHSEKLAISFGLINSVDSTPLRLVQGHRICSDCHKAIKLMALVTKREIVVRDSSRFHRFKNGTCACGDYW